MFDEQGNPFFRRKLTPKSVEFEDVQPENSRTPMVKKLSGLKIALKRSGYDSTMRPKTWYGLQEIEISIPQEKEFRYYFLVFLPRIMENVCVKILNPDVKDSFGNYNSIAWTMNLSPTKSSIEYGWVRYIGKPKTITYEKLQSLLQNKEIIAVLNDQGMEQAF